MAIISVDIVSDVICPWCFIGYRSLQRAIALYQKTYPGGSKDQFEISWKPYFLDQDAPQESVLIYDRMSRRMNHSQIEAAQTRLRRVGATLGINFRFGGYIGSSRLAHRLLYMAGQEGWEMQCRVAERLFRAQFEEEKDVSYLDVVVEVGVQSRLGEESIRGFLAGDSGVVETESEAESARQQGIQGVPHFIIGGKHHFDGAADFDEFFAAFVASRGNRDT